MFLIFLGIIFQSITSFAAVPCTNNEKPTYNIFFVHGLAGNTNAFGAMGEALMEHLPMINSCYTYSYYNISYETGHQSKNSYDFIEELGEQIQKHFLNGQVLKDGDKISLIAHSQGGIVSSIWYFKSLSGEKPEWKRYAQNVDAIISIGTPFWGSKIANFGISVWKSFPGVNYFLKKFNLGLGELEALSPGSDITENFHHRAIEFDQNIEFQNSVKFRPLSIAGVTTASHSTKLNQWREGFNLDEPLSSLKEFYTGSLKYWVVNAAQKKGFGAYRYESDIAVPLPSARPNFYYYQDFNEDYLDGEAVASTQFKLNQLTSAYEEVPFVILETIHASVVPDKTYDLVALPKRCLNFKDCDHPTYPYVLSHIADCIPEKNGCRKKRHDELMKYITEATSKRFNRFNDNSILGQMRGFILEVSLRLPQDYSHEWLEDLNAENILKIINFERKAMEDTQLGLAGVVDIDKLKNPRNRPVQESSSSYEVYVAREIEKLSTIGLVTVGNENESEKVLRLHLTGLLTPEVSENMKVESIEIKLDEFSEQVKKGVPLKFTIQLPGLKSRQIEALVKPSYATYVDVVLQ